MLPASAHAGAWIAPKGGQEIWTNAAGQRDGVNVFETSAYYEIPTNDTVAVVAAPWVEQADDLGDDGWRAEATLGLKTALIRNDRGAMALQAGAVWTSDPDRGCGEAGAELRWLGGVSFGPQGRGFLNLEAAGRVQDGGCPSQRFEFTAGYRPDQRWLAMGQVFLDAPREGDQAVKVQLSLVRFGTEGQALQFGIRTRLDGGASETAFVLGFWGRPAE